MTAEFKIRIAELRAALDGPATLEGQGFLITSHDGTNVLDFEAKRLDGGKTQYVSLGGLHDPLKAMRFSRETAKQIISQLGNDDLQLAATYWRDVAEYQISVLEALL